jgi:hypothetical protein
MQNLKLYVLPHEDIKIHVLMNQMYKLEFYRLIFLFNQKIPPKIKDHTEIID